MSSWIKSLRKEQLEGYIEEMIVAKPEGDINVWRFQSESNCEENKEHLSATDSGNVVSPKVQGRHPYPYMVQPGTYS